MHSSYKRQGERATEVYSFFCTCLLYIMQGCSKHTCTYPNPIRLGGRHCRYCSKMLSKRWPGTYPKVFLVSNIAESPNVLVLNFYLFRLCPILHFPESELHKNYTKQKAALPFYCQPLFDLKMLQGLLLQAWSWHHLLLPTVERMDLSNS